MAKPMSEATTTVVRLKMELGGKLRDIALTHKTRPFSEELVCMEVENYLEHCRFIHRANILKELAAVKEAVDGKNED